MTVMVSILACVCVRCGASSPCARVLCTRYSGDDAHTRICEDDGFFSVASSLALCDFEESLFDRSANCVYTRHEKLTHATCNDSIARVVAFEAKGCERKGARYGLFH